MSFFIPKYKVGDRVLFKGKFSLDSNPVSRVYAGKIEKVRWFLGWNYDLEDRDWHPYPPCIPQSFIIKKA